MRSSLSYQYDLFRAAPSEPQESLFNSTLTQRIYTLVANDRACLNIPFLSLQKRDASEQLSSKRKRVTSTIPSCQCQNLSNAPQTYTPCLLTRTPAALIYLTITSAMPCLRIGMSGFALTHAMVVG